MQKQSVASCLIVLISATMKIQVLTLSDIILVHTVYGTVYSREVNQGHFSVIIDPRHGDLVGVALLR